jgi:hypothetical protein
MSKLLAVFLGMSLGLLFGACRVSPEVSVEGAPEACCTKSDRQLQNFKGCRVGSRCRKAEKFWMQGLVSCGPVDEAACEGGRCCHYEQLYDPNAGVPYGSEAAPGARPASDAAEPEAAPEKAPVTETPVSETPEPTEEPTSETPAPAPLP